MTAEDDLLSQIASGSHDAMSRFVSCFSRLIRCVANRRLRNQADVDDVTQEVYLKVWCRAGQHRPGRSVRGWVRGITRNAVCDHFRSMGRLWNQSPDSKSEFEVPDYRGEEWEETQRQAEQDRKVASVTDFIHSLPGRQQDAVGSVYLSGLTHEAVAAAMGCPVGTVKTWVRKARLRMRKELADV